jgi:cell division septation protein DedD
MPLIVVKLVDAAMALQPALAKPAGTPSKSSAPAPTSVMSGPVERFHVQLGSFEEGAEAQALFLTLRDRGYVAHLAGGPPYLVRVGGYLDEPTAKRLAATLRAAGFEATLKR